MNETSPGADVASLSRLHDIVAPPPVSWWPPAPGWDIVGAAILILLIWSAWHLIVWWRKNAYRREALTLLRVLPVDSSGLLQVDEILKRVALSAFPREQVASLSGVAWLEFLDQTESSKEFVEGTGRVLGEAPYVSNVPQGDVGEVIAAAEHWVRRHKEPHSC